MLLAKVEFSSNANSAFDEIYKLKLNKADLLIENEIKTKPENAFAYYLKSLKEIIEVFVSENEKEYQNLNSNLKKNIKQIEKKAAKTPYNKFFKAQLLFYYGITQF